MFPKNGGDLCGPRAPRGRRKEQSKYDKIIVLFSETEAAKQNQKFPFHFLSAPPTPPPEEKKKGKEIFGFAPATAGSGRGARSERTIRVQATTHAERAISYQSDYCENMFELFLTNTASLDYWN